MLSASLNKTFPFDHLYVCTYSAYICLGSSTPFWAPKSDTTTVRRTRRLDASHIKQRQRFEAGYRGANPTPTTYTSYTTRQLHDAPVTLDDFDERPPELGVGERVTHGVEGAVEVAQAVRDGVQRGVDVGVAPRHDDGRDQHEVRRPRHDVHGQDQSYDSQRLAHVTLVHLTRLPARGRQTGSPSHGAESVLPRDGRRSGSESRFERFESVSGKRGQRFRLSDFTLLRLQCGTHHSYFVREVHDVIV